MGAYNGNCEKNNNNNKKITEFFLIFFFYTLTLNTRDKNETRSRSERNSDAGLGIRIQIQIQIQIRIRTRTRNLNWILYKMRQASQRRVNSSSDEREIHASQPRYFLWPRNVTVGNRRRNSRYTQTVRQPDRDRIHTHTHR